MAENLPTLARDPQIEGVHPIEDKPKDIMPRHVGIKLVQTAEENNTPPTGKTVEKFKW